MLKIPMTTITKQQCALMLLRLVLAIIIASHGWHRLLSGGYQPFGEWLTSQNIPFGLAVAWAITLVEVLGSVLLALGKQVTVLCAIYIAIYATGLVMVHLPHGWFVVGSGTNGIEYSTLLIATLFYVAIQNNKSAVKIIE
jgi:putative oxidoreductase